MLSYEQAVALAPTIDRRLLRSLDTLELEAFEVLQANGAADAVAAYPDSPSSTEERVALCLSPTNAQCKLSMKFKVEEDGGLVEVKTTEDGKVLLSSLDAHSETFRWWKLDAGKGDYLGDIFKD
jgi:hypothetical protein